MDIYKLALRPLMFSGLKVDPEAAHRHFIGLCERLSRRCAQPPETWIIRQLSQQLTWTDERLAQRLWGVKFANPIGLAAGFDKDGVASNVWSAFGFGFAELGTVTTHAQPGNPQPRLFRLPADQSAINRMGFNNQGAASMAAMLAAAQTQRLTSLQQGGVAIPIGINLGKSKITPLATAAADYCQGFRLLQEFGDYVVVNVSSPNTPGLRSLQSVEQLEPILKALQQENAAFNKPILVKISPDLAWEDISAILELGQRYGLAGVIATNTTTQRDRLKTQQILATGKTPQEETGGLSGAPLRTRSTEVIQFIWNATQGQMPIIGVGGVFSAQDAWEKLAAGASLVQVYTGWAYEGPWMVRRILQGLVQALQSHGLDHIKEIVGTNLPYRTE